MLKVEQLEDRNGLSATYFQLPDAVGQQILMVVSDSAEFYPVVMSAGALADVTRAQIQDAADQLVQIPHAEYVSTPGAQHWTLGQPVTADPELAFLRGQVVASYQNAGGPTVTADRVSGYTVSVPPNTNDSIVEVGYAGAITPSVNPQLYEFQHRVDFSGGAWIGLNRFNASGLPAWQAIQMADANAKEIPDPFNQQNPGEWYALERYEWELTGKAFTQDATVYFNAGG